MDNINEEEAKSISIENMRKNHSQIDVTRTFLSIVGGIIAGILGCTGLKGLACFIAVYLSIASALASKMGRNTKLYTNMNFLYFCLSDLQKNSLSFVLFWTLTYALVYIY